MLIYSLRQVWSHFDVVGLKRGGSAKRNGYKYVCLSLDGQTLPRIVLSAVQLAKKVKQRMKVIILS